MSWIRNNLTALSVAFSNVEKSVLGQEKLSAENDLKQERRHLQGTLADSLVRGEITQEVKNLRWRTYKVIKAVYGTSVVIEGYDNNGNPIYQINKTKDKRLLKKIKVDDFDDYKLEMVFQNSEITNSITDVVNEIDETEHLNLLEYLVKNKTEKPIIVFRERSPNFYIEHFTKKINVRRITKNSKMLEFYVSKYPDEYNKNTRLLLKQIEKIIGSKPANKSFLDFDSVSFVTNNTIGAEDLLLFKYDIISFDKIIEFDGNYVIKFKAKVVKNGEDVLAEYIESELDKKYENKESKK